MSPPFFSTSTLNKRTYLRTQPPKVLRLDTALHGSTTQTDEYCLPGSPTSIPVSRLSSSSSTSAFSGSVAYAQSKATASLKKHVNVYTTCGRHSNEWLFSGWPSPFRRKDDSQ